MEKNILEKLTNIDDVYITESWEQCKSKKSSIHITWKSVAAAVAIICLSSSVVLAATILGPKLIKMYSSEQESGFDVKLNIKRISIDELHGPIMNLKNVFIRQYITTPAWSNTSPGHYSNPFSSPKEVIEYIGYEHIYTPQWKYQPDSINLTANGNENGNLTYTSMESDYLVNNVRLQEMESLYFLDYEEDPITGVVSAEYQEYTEDSFVSDEGNTWLIIKSSQMESGYYGKDAYYTWDNVLYSLHMSYLEDDAIKAEKIMQDWINAFSFK